MSTITDPHTILARAARLVAVVTGEPYGDGELVTDVGIGYADGDPSAVWVAGDWNDASDYDAETRTWTVRDNTPSRLAAALERVGVSLEWLDNGSTCHECGQWVQTEPDSYSWEPNYILTDSGWFACGACAREDAAELLALFTNDADKAITEALLGDVDPEDYGFRRHPDDHTPDYANGWHEGQDDNPHAIAERIRAEHGDDVDVLFIITEVSQFYLRFAAYWRDADHAED